MEVEVDNIEPEADNKNQETSKNMKLTNTDIEVLEKKVSFFPEALLNAPVRKSKTNMPINQTPIMTPKPINQISSVRPMSSIKPINQIMGRRRGMGMRFM